MLRFLSLASALALTGTLLSGISLPGFAAAQQMRAMLPSQPLRIAEIYGERVPGRAGRNAPRITFDAAKSRFSASVGCNRIGGGYAVNGKTFRFSRVFATRMACPGATGRRERAFLAALERVRGWRVDKRGLMFTDGSGKTAIRVAAP